MKRITIYFLIILLAVWIGLKIRADVGYVLIAYRGYSIETTLWMAILVLLFTFFLFYIFFRLLHNSRVLPKRLKFWWHNYREIRAIKITDRGLLKLAEGAWVVAEKYLLKGSRFSPNPFLNYLNAAEAAQKLQAFGRRDDHLEKALSEMGKSEYAVGITRARMQVASRQWKSALALLKHLQGINQRQRLVLDLLHRVYLELADWQSLRDLLPLLRKRLVLSPEAYGRLEELVYLQLLKAIIARENISAGQKFWLQMPRHLHKNDALAFCYVNYLIENGSMMEAEQILLAAIKKFWHAKLLELYARISSEKPINQLKRAERWLKNHANDSALYLCLGRLCKNQQLWGKAQNYLEKSIQLAPSSAAYLELGEIMALLGQMQNAMAYCRDGLKLSMQKSI